MEKVAATNHEGEMGRMRKVRMKGEPHEMGIRNREKQNRPVKSESDGYEDEDRVSLNPGDQRISFSCLSIEKVGAGVEVASPSFRVPLENAWDERQRIFLLRKQTLIKVSGRR